MRRVLPPDFGFGGHIPTSLKGLPLPGHPLCVEPGSPSGSPANMMLRAVVVSMASAGQTIPNPAVGCIFSNSQQILATGSTETFGGRHAERVAFENLRISGTSASGLECYVTLEPCSHHGKQPPCCELFANSNLSRLFVAQTDPNPLVDGRGLRYLSDQHIPVETMRGEAHDAATAWLLPFLVQHRLGRPLIAGKWAQTLDGALADSRGTSQWITGPSARAHGHWLRLKYDVTAVGLNTFIQDRPSLTVRDCWRPNLHQPHVCIIDPAGKANPSDPSFKKAMENLLAADQDRKVALLCPWHRHGALKERIPAELTLLGFEHSPNQRSFGAALQEAWTKQDNMKWLGRPPQSIYIEGGGTLLSLLIEANALDVLHVFTAPMLLGGAALRVGGSTEKSPDLSMAAHFDILSTSLLDNDMLVELVPRRIYDLFFARG